MRTALSKLLSFVFPVDSDEEAALAAPVTLRWWPLVVYISICLLNAALIAPLSETLYPPNGSPTLTWGMIVGFGAFLAVSAGICGQSLLRNVLLSSLLAVLIFALPLWSVVHLSENAQTDSPFQILAFGFNAPLVILGAALPLIAFRWYTGWQLSRHPVQLAKARLNVEQLLHITTVTACLLIMGRISIDVNQFHERTVISTLFVVVVCSAVVVLILVLPTLKWLFESHARAMPWYTAVAITAALITLPCFAIHIFVSAAFRARLTTIYELASVLSIGLLLYLPGLLALRACGFRWVRASKATCESVAISHDKPSPAAARIWVGAFLLCALLATVYGAIVDKYATEDSSEQIAVRNRLISVRNLLISEGGVLASNEEQITSLRLTQKNLDEWLSRAEEFEWLGSLTLVDCELTEHHLKLLKQLSLLRELKLIKTPVPDRLFDFVDSMLHLQSLELSDTTVNFEQLAQLLSTRPKITSVALNNMAVTDDLLRQLYQPHIVRWSLQGNQITSSGFQSILLNPATQALDFSNNPVDDSLFVKLGTGTPLFLAADQCHFDDSSMAQLLKKERFSGIKLGKTDVTVAGLNSCFNSPVWVELRDGSFTEEQLSSIAANADGSMLSLKGTAWTGRFLRHWTGLPSGLELRNTNVTDDDLLALPYQSWHLTDLMLTGTQVSDAILPLLFKTQPLTLDIGGTKLTAKGLSGQRMPRTRLIVEPGQFSIKELKLLRRNFQSVQLRFLEDN